MQLKLYTKKLKSNIKFIVFTWMSSYNESIIRPAQENDSASKSKKKHEEKQRVKTKRKGFVL